MLVVFLSTLAAISFKQTRRARTEQRITGMVPGDVNYSEKSQIVTLAIGSIGGGFTSAVGLGGASVVNPVLMGMGVPPTVAAATSMYMVAFNTVLNTLTYWLFGSLPVRYALWIGFWSGLGIAAFLWLVGQFIRRYEKPSTVVFALALVLTLSTVVVPTVNVKHLME